MSDWIEPPAKAPPFDLVSDEGRRIRLADLKGRPIVLYFYPKDDTPGCTREACAFRDQSAELKKLGAVVLGVSADSVESHQRFRKKYALNFSLLADTDHRVAEAYGAWREKNMYGKKSMGIQRSTFLIDSTGSVARVWEKVQVDGHDADVLGALRSLVAMDSPANSPSRTEAAVAPKGMRGQSSRQTLAKKSSGKGRGAAKTTGVALARAKPAKSLASKKRVKAAKQAKK